MQISERLRTVAGAVTSGGIVADVGCDHAFTSIYMIENGIADRVIAMDVGVGPLQRATEHIAAYGMENRIETRLSDGLSELRSGEVQTVLISGMGGALMVRILSEGGHVLEGIEELVLSPQSEIHLVRRFLLDSGFEIDREYILCEQGKYYTVLHAVVGTELPYDAVELHYGRSLLREGNVVLADYLQKEENRVSRILERFADGGLSGTTQRRKEQLQEELTLLRQAQERAADVTGSCDGREEA